MVGKRIGSRGEKKKVKSGGGSEVRRRITHNSVT